MTSPAQYTLACQAIMMAYTLLAPDGRTVADLDQHLKDMYTQYIEMHPNTSDKHLINQQRELFFEAFDALTDALKGKWFQLEP